MAPTPTALRAAADRVRSSARRLAADVEPLTEKGDEQTWEGPAASSYRLEAGAAEDRAAEIVTGLRRLADHLDRDAQELAVALEAEARAEAAARAERRRESRPPPFLYRTDGPDVGAEPDERDDGVPGIEGWVPDDE